MKSTLEWLNVILGAWLFLSPWILGFTGTSAAAWSAWIVGALVVIFALWTLSDRASWEDWVNFVVAIVGFLTPWLFGFAGVAAAAWNLWIVSLAIAIVALWAAYTPAEPKATS